MKNLFMCAALALSPDQFDSTKEQSREVLLNPWEGNVYFSITPSYNVDDPNGPKVAVIKLCANSHMPTTTNNFGTLGYQHSCIYMPLTPTELTDMTDKVNKWIDNPYISQPIYVKLVQ